MMQNNITGPKPSISIVTITLNEEAAIAKVVPDLRQVIGDSEIIVVDSSTDRTAEIANGLGCKVIKQIPPKGYGNAYHEGFQAAKGDIIITLDCDDTYPVQSIPALVEKIQAGFDLVSASRLKKRPQTMPFANYVANCVFACTAFLICGVKSTDLHTGMRAYRREMLQKFPYESASMALAVELYLGPARCHYRCTEIFIDYHERIGASKLQPIAGTIGTFKRIWKWRRWKNVDDISATST
jgi:glycosyltransferase involved in cell wall biosynthesis